MTATQAPVAEAVAALAAELTKLIEGERSATGDNAQRAELDVFARLLRPLTLLAEFRRGGETLAPLPVCRYLAGSLAAGGDVTSRLVAPLEKLARFFAWTQNPNYRHSPPSSDFLDNYGYAVIAGPKHGAPVLIEHPDLAFGLLLLGPHTTYPAHHHPASEIYVPLGSAEWMKGDAPFAVHEAGSVIHHPPNLTHATRTGSLPLAALYLWAGDLGTHARLASTLIDR